MEILDNGMVYIVGIDGYDGVSIIAVCSDWQFACDLADAKRKELKTQISIYPYEITHEF